LATTDQADPDDREHCAQDAAERLEDCVTVDDAARDLEVGQFPVPRSLEPDILPEPPGSSTLGMLVRLGGAIAAAAVVALLVVGKLAGWNAATPSADEASGVTAAKPVAGQEASASTLPALVIGAAAPAAVDDLIPFGISIVNGSNVDGVLLSGLPSGSTMTNGRPSATGGWYLFPHELADTAIRPAKGFVGGADVAVELRRSESLVDRRTLHLEWTSAAPRATSEAASPPIIGASISQLPHHDVAEDHEALFREFLQWQASRSVRR